jgi:hypothetical protein
MTINVVWKRIFAAALLVTALALIFESMIPASGIIFAISALVCGIATWVVPVLALARFWYRDRTGPKPTSLQSVGRTIFFIVSAVCFSAIGLPLALVTVALAPDPYWAWLALLTIVAFWTLGVFIFWLRNRST